MSATDYEEFRRIEALRNTIGDSPDTFRNISSLARILGAVALSTITVVVTAVLQILGRARRLIGPMAPLRAAYSQVAVRLALLAGAPRRHPAALIRRTAHTMILAARRSQATLARAARMVSIATSRRRSAPTSIALSLISSNTTLTFLDPQTLDVEILMD